MMGGEVNQALHITALWLVLLVAVTNGTHFLAGRVSCGPDSQSYGGFDAFGNVQVECSFRIAWGLPWQRNQTMCTDQIRNNMVRLPGPSTEGQVLSCKEGCSGTFAELSYYCTEFSSVPGATWSQGGGIFRYTFNGSPARFTASLSSCCWMDSLRRYGGENYTLLTSMNLMRRADTGEINYAPSTHQPAILRIWSGHERNLSLLVEDPDGDIVRCRWGSTSNIYGQDECGGICPPLHDAKLIANPCTLWIPPTLEPGYYHAVSIVLEDFPLSDPYGEPLSQTSFQILLDVQTPPPGTFSHPELVEPSPENKTCIPIPSGTEYRVTLRARQATPVNKIWSFSMTQPVGMDRSRIVNGIENGEHFGEIQLSWRPTLEQYGPRLFCFQATDHNGDTTELRCVTLMAGGKLTSLSVRSITCLSLLHFFVHCSVCG
eukprot:scpid74156/ scgid5613/ 